MFIKNLKLKNYRNYDDIEISFDSNKILFIGKNAQGKTNLLESIYYLSALDSLRAKSDNELISWGKDFCCIKAEINKFDVNTELEVYINPPSRKKLKVNGINKSKSSEFISNISTVSFTVNDLLLLRGTPEDRRKWLDVAICQIFPAYIERLSKYNKVRIQKNNYLKNLKGNINADSSMLDIWNEQLAITGSNIIFIRLNFLYEIQKIAMKKHKLIADNEELSIIYNSTIIDDITFSEKTNPTSQSIAGSSSLSDCSSAKNTTGENILTTSIYNEFSSGNVTVEYISEKFKQKLNEKKYEEIVRAQSVIGPHRDDLSFYINNIESKKFASQGQQRTIVLSLKLAELQLIKEKINTNAILLLDDVLAELDDLRQNFLLDAIGDKTQTIITSVDTLHFKNEYLKDVEIFEIKDNKVIKNDGK